MVVRHSEAAYEQQMTGERLSYRMHQRERPQCPECATDLVARSLTAQHQSQNGIGRGPQWENIPLPADPLINRASLPNMVGSVGCPVKGCRGRVTGRTNLRIHFVYRHMQDMIVIMEEGNFPHPHCPC